MKSDSEIKADVDAELRWSPEIDETDIATKVRKGVVTLTGFASHVSVDASGSEVTMRGEISWFEHDQAQATAWSAPGVTSVKNEISVRI